MSDWTTYGKQQMFLVATGVIAMPQLYVALYSTSADPTGTPAELAVSGYNRMGVNFASTSTDHVGPAADVVFGPLGAGSYIGVAIHDDPDFATPWFWNDESGPITIPNHTLVTFPALSSLVIARTS